MASLMGRSFGNIALQAWYDGGFKPYTIEEARAYYDEIDPTFIAQLGDDTAKIPQDRMKSALTSLAAQMGPTYPSRGDFYGALVDAGVSDPSFSDVASAAGQGVMQAVDFGGSFLKWVIPLAIVGLLIVYGRPIMKAASRFSSAF